ncbi:MAG TPA: serine/threonine-protein kinase [Gemmatimonadales bacterium]|jgi:serine/threonine-protein kinase|nr:serine/threonine-protein kinase [Gemmatimonadales bacterium]
MTPTTSSHWLRDSGLDTSSGSEFVQRRVALFAKLIASISFGFFSINLLIGWVYHIPASPADWGTPAIANLIGLGSITAIWLITRRGTLSISALGWIDAIAIVGCCTAWSFFFSPEYPETMHSAVISVTMTLMARAIVIPSKAGRTFRLTILSVLLLVIRIWIWLDPFTPKADGLAAYGPWITVINQTLVLAVLVTLTTVTSRILYDLRRSIREANELGQYLLEEKLGAGGMGEVWRARHRLLLRPAAVKLIRPELLALGHTDQEALLRRFEREALATAALRSPHTVQLYDFGQAEDGTLFYVMELLEGIDLEHLVSRFGPVPPERAIHILKQVCHALDEAHQNGLTHRDIKPANIFISGTGTELDFVKVLDFGLVRLNPATTSQQVLNTNEETVGGTPAYVAPEVVTGEAGYDHRVDLYAVGCVGYWLLSGRLVFEAGTAMGMLIDHARTQAPPLRSRTELVIPADLEHIIMDCLEKDPSRRPGSAAELARRLSECMASGQWTRERAEQWWRTHAPQPPQERPLADVLLSREGSSRGMRELRHRRGSATLAGKS